MAARKKPGVYPDWLLEEKPGVCKWICSVCGGPVFYRAALRGHRKRDGVHGGPRHRGLDRRYSAPYQGPCWRSKIYGVKCATPKGWRYLYHEGAPNPGQPDQPDAVWRTDNVDQEEGQL